MHRAELLRGLIDAAREFAFNHEDLLEQAGLQRDVLEYPDHLISYSATCGLLEECFRRSGRDDFGLQVGRHTGLDSMGLVGIEARTSGTVRAGLQSVADHLNITSGVSTVWLSEAEGSAVVRYAICAPTSMPTRQYYDAAMGILRNIVCDLCGLEWAPSEVRFSHRRPDNVRAFRGFFRGPLRFDSSEYAIVFDSTWLQQPLPTANAQLHARVARQLARARQQIMRDTQGFTRRSIRKLLSVGRCSISEVAALMGIHRRTLDRRLDAQGTSFSEELESVRRQMAREFLEDTHLSIGDISAALSYSSVSSFCTAFLRWNGMTASAFRSEQQARRGSEEAPVAPLIES